MEQDAMEQDAVALEIERFLSERGMARSVPDRQANWFDAGLLDSMSFVLLLAHIEQRWGIEIDVTALRMEDYASVAATARTVLRLVEAERVR